MYRSERLRFIECVIRCYWGSLGVIVGHCGSLGVIGGHWGLLGVIGGHWGSLGAIGLFRYTRIFSSIYIAFSSSIYMCKVFVMIRHGYLETLDIHG